MSGWITLGVLVLLGGYIAMLYNNLVNVKNNMAKAWSNIDVLLKQRHDELPKLVDTCKEYMGYEQETLVKVMDARNQVHEAHNANDLGALGAAESTMRLGLGKLFALAENYPDLKANESFNHLQKRISGLADAISDRREFYNESVNVNNIAIESFPNNLVAKCFNFPAGNLLEFSEEEKADVNVGELFKS